MRWLRWLSHSYIKASCERFKFVHFKSATARSTASPPSEGDGERPFHPAPSGRGAGAMPMRETSEAGRIITYSRRWWQKQEYPQEGTGKGLTQKARRKGDGERPFHPAPSGRGAEAMPMREASEAGLITTYSRRWWQNAVFPGTCQSTKTRNTRRKALERGWHGEKVTEKDRFGRHLLERETEQGHREAPLTQEQLAAEKTESVI